MNNLNKKMSLAVKLMTLAVMMNIATGCDSCKKDDKGKDGDKKAEVTVSFNNKEIKGTVMTEKFKINNTAKEGELDTEMSDLEVCVMSTIYKTDGTKEADAAELKMITYTFGSASGNASIESKVSLKDVVKAKIAATKSTNDLDFKITAGLDPAKHSKAEFKIALKDKAGKDVNSDMLMWTKQ